MKHLANAVAAIVPDNGVAVFLGMLLYHVADITQPGAGFDQFNAFI